MASAHYTERVSVASKEKHSVDSAAQNGLAPGGQTGTARVKRGMAEMLKGGVIMDVVTAEQARIAEGPAPSR